MAGRQLNFDYNAALKAAMGVFWERGYEASSVQDLLEAMNIPKGSLYNTFKSKDELYTRALQYYRETVASSLLEKLEGSGSRVEAIREFFRSVISVSIEDGSKGCLMLGAAVEHASQQNRFFALASDTFSLIEQALNRELEVAKERGELKRDSDPVEIARYLMSLFYGIRIQAAMGVTQAQLEKMVELALSETLA